MDNVTLMVVRPPADPSEHPSATVHAIHELARDNADAEFGNSDDVWPPHALMASMLDSPYRERVFLVAVEGRQDPATVLLAAGTAPIPGRILGYARGQWALRDNPHLAEVSVQVARTHRGRGIGTALADAIEHRAAAAGRSTLVAETRIPPAPTIPAAAAQVVGALTSRLPAEHPGVRFLSARGYATEQVMRQAMLQLPPPAGSLEALRGEAATAAGEAYAVVRWVGPTPPERREQFARLRQRMSVDTPAGGLAFGEETWDAERVRQIDEQLAGLGRVNHVVAIERDARLVAYSEACTQEELPEVLLQGDTLVHGDHRGHRLGLLVKAELHLLLQAQAPGERRLHTWNAEENTHMRAINDRLGYELLAYESGWQRVLD